MARKRHPLTYRRLQKDGTYTNNKTPKIVYPHVTKELQNRWLRYISTLGYTAIARWFQDGGFDHIMTGDYTYADKPWETLGISKREFQARKAEAFNIFCWLLDEVLVHEFDEKLSEKPNPFTLSSSHPKWTTSKE